MLDQDPREQLLREVAGIGVGVPYSATIKNENVEFSGQAIFSVGDRLTFKFFSEALGDTDLFLDISDAVELRIEAELHISLLDLLLKTRPTRNGIGAMGNAGLMGNIGIIGNTGVLWNTHDPSWPPFIRSVYGVIQDTWFGGKVDGLTSLVVGYSGIPRGWYGNANSWHTEKYYDGSGQHFHIPRIEMNCLDWSVCLQSEIDYRVVCLQGGLDGSRVIGGVWDIAKIKKINPFSSCEAQQFLLNLHYLLSFLFGSNPGMVYAKGAKEYEHNWVWGGLGHLRSPSEYQRYLDNSIFTGNALSDIFRTFLRDGGRG